MLADGILPVRRLVPPAMLLAAACTTAEDWPEFRGPTGQGHSAERSLPVEWSPGRNVAWKAAIPGRGWSSPVVASSRVYLTTAVEERQGPEARLSLRALALEARTGRTAWEVEVFREDSGKTPGIHSKNSHASPTPLVAGRRLFVHFGHLGTACLGVDGKALWRSSVLRYSPVHGSGGSPILAGDALVVSCDGAEEPFVTALSSKTGDLLWKTPRRTSAAKSFSFSTPLLIEVQGKKQVVSPGSDAVMAYDPSTGEELWRVRYEGYSVVPRPVHGHGLVFVCTGYDTPELLAIRPDGRGDVTDTHVAWSRKRAVPHTPSLLLAGEELFLVTDGGIASCLDARTGEVHWQGRIDGSFSASPVLAGGRIYLQSEDGVGFVLRAGKEFLELGMNPLDEPSLATPAAADGALFIRTEKHLFRIEER